MQKAQREAGLSRVFGTDLGGCGTAANMRRFSPRAMSNYGVVECARIRSSADQITIAPALTPGGAFLSGSRRSS
jgi:hypothetical protein